MHDPYAFPPMMGELDLHLLGEGQHWKSYEKLGAQLRTVDGVAGVNFAVWAPNAEASPSSATSTCGIAAATRCGSTSRPAFGNCSSRASDAGTKYKFAVKHRGGHVVDKCDPYGFFAEVPPRTANIVTDLNSYHWNDAEWIRTRSQHNGLDAPISVYEMHLGSWRRDPGNPERWLSYGEIAPQLVEYCQADGLHAHGAAAGQRASVHRQLGLSDDRLLRRHEPLRHAAGLHALRRSAATRTASA